MSFERRLVMGLVVSAFLVLVNQQSATHLGIGCAKESCTQPYESPVIAKPSNHVISDKTSPKERNEDDSCPLAVRKAVGVYAKEENSITGTHNPFSNVVLLTASNSEFVELLHNWEEFSVEHGLKYAVLAMDQALYDKLGPERAIPSDPNFAVKHVGPYNKKRYNTLVCNKMRLILQILVDCQVDVVFSDADNVLLQDPFRHDLGYFIQKSYDYLYTTNDGWTAEPKSDPCLIEGTFDKREGNTGFEYIRSNVTWIQHVMSKTIRRCERPNNRHHDQYLFWWHMRRTRDDEWFHCSLSKPDPPSSAKATMCCLDPHYYPVGATRPNESQSLVTFHANYVKTQQEKIERLRLWAQAWKNVSS
jgi:hypothetical protein